MYMNISWFVFLSPHSFKQFLNRSASRIVFLVIIATHQLIRDVLWNLNTDYIFFLFSNLLFDKRNKDCILFLESEIGFLNSVPRDSKGVKIHYPFFWGHRVCGPPEYTDLERKAIFRWKMYLYPLKAALGASAKCIFKHPEKTVSPEGKLFILQEMFEEYWCFHLHHQIIFSWSYIFAKHHP